MISSVSSLASLIARSSSVTEARPPAAASALSGTNAPDFAQVLAEVSTSAIDTLKAGEAAAISGIQGKASAQQVVEAVMSAEQTLQSAIAIRDKVVSAYQEISRMQI